MPYLAAKNTVVTINGTVRGFTDGSYDTGTATDEMTNTEEGGYGRDIGTVKRATINGTIAYKSEAPLDFDEDDEVEVSITNTGGPGLTGTFLVTNMTDAGRDRRGRGPARAPAARPAGVGARPAVARRGPAVGAAPLRHGPGAGRGGGGGGG
jgi:hypothetical protein